MALASWSQTVTGLRTGDIDARDRVVRLVIGCLRSLGAYEHRDSWADVVQDVLVTLLERLPSSEDDAAVATWIRRVTIHRYVDQIRKEQGRRREGGELTVGWRRSIPLEEAHLLDEAALERALEHDLCGALQALDTRKRGVLECKYALGCADAEGALRLGEALGTYKRLVRQALAELRQALIDEPSPGESKSKPVPSQET